MIEGSDLIGLCNMLVDRADDFAQRRFCAAYEVTMATSITGSVPVCRNDQPGKFWREWDERKMLSFA